MFILHLFLCIIFCFKVSCESVVDVDKLAKEIYLQNVEAGWWKDANRCIFTSMQLISTEIAEATEGERKGLMDEHLPHRKMAEVELADA